MEAPAGYRTPYVAAVVGVSYRQMDYWCRSDLVRPSVVDAKGSGNQRVYSVDDIVLLAVVKDLLDHGASLQSVQAVVPVVRESLYPDIGGPLWVRVATDGVSVVGSIDDAVTAEPRPTLFTVIDLRRVIEDVRSALEASS